MLEALDRFLADQDASRVRTVAYVAGAARADAALIALACDHVVMDEQAVLGGPGAQDLSEDEAEYAKQAIRQLAQAKSQVIIPENRPWWRALWPF